MCSLDRNNRRQVITRPGARPVGVSIDAELARLSEAQHGVVTREGLLAAGLDADQIDYRVKVGRLRRVHRGVYAVGHVPQLPLARAMAAVLACGPGAVLSHRWAAALLEILSHWRAPIDVTAPRPHRLRGVRVHRSRTLTPRDVTVHCGIPVTTPVRTLLDLAEVLDRAALARAVNQAQVLRLVRLEDLAAPLARSRGRHGARHLRELVDRPSARSRQFRRSTALAPDLPRRGATQEAAGGPPPV